MDKLWLEPLGNYIIMDIPENTEKVTTGGIIVPDKARERPDMGIVLAVGKGLVSLSGERIPTTVQVGDRVYFQKYAPFPMEYKDKKYYVISEGEIIGIDRSEEKSDEG